MTAFAIVALILSPSIVAAYSLAQKRWEIQRADLREARDVIDIAALQINRERDAVHRLLEVWRMGMAVEAFNDAIEHANATRVESRTVLSRVIFRFGRDADITKRYQDVLDEVELVNTAISEHVTKGSAHDPSLDEKFSDNVSEHVVEFEDAGYALVRVKLARRHTRGGPTVREQLAGQAP